MNNPYLPKTAILKRTEFENDAKDIKTFDFEFENKDDAKDFEFICGQFGMVSVFGAGEAPFGMASSPMDKDVVQFSIKKYSKGVLTNSLYNLSVGDKLGLRGPFGNGYPMEMLKGKNILIVGGGFALTTLRSTAKYILHEKNRGDYGKLSMLVAARNPGEILYKNDLAELSKRSDIEIVQAIDMPADGWKGKVGFAAAVLEQMAPSSDNTYALVCGPPIMIKTCIKTLYKVGFAPEKIISSLEMKMKCGIGTCGRCGVGSKYVCKDGPVYTYAELQKLSSEY
jgi:sulfhydrogenase subunit gamma (sulfur reductase)